MPRPVLPVACLILLVVRAGGGAMAAGWQGPDGPARAALERQSGPLSTVPVTRLEEGDPADLDAGRAVSITFADPLPVRDVLFLLFRGTPFSIVFDPEATGTFTGELSNLTPREALEAVLHSTGLDYDVKGTVVRVFPRRTETRLFDAGHPDVRRTLARRLRSGAGDPAVAASDLAAVTSAGFFAELGEGIRSLLSAAGRFHVDAHAGLVQVTDFADRLDRIDLYISAVALRAERQVRLDARVLEVLLTRAPAIDWDAVALRLGPDRGRGAGLLVESPGVLASALEAFGDVRLIAAPRVLAMNNEPAVMRVGSQPAAGGVTLAVTAQIGADGFVRMSVSPTFVEPEAGRDRASLSIVEADSVVRVRDGETAVFAGLLRDLTDAVPASGLAGVFGATAVRTRKTELIVLITPTIVSHPGAPAGAR